MTTPNSDDKKKRARRGDGAIYWDDEKNCYRGAISLGYTPAGKRRRKVVYGSTKAEVRDKFKTLRDELEQGVESSPKYTVAEAVNAWLERGLVGRDPKTVTKNRHLAAAHVIPGLGAAKLRDLTLEQVEDWLHDEKDNLATSTLKSCLSVLSRSIRHAQRHKRIAYNVAELATVPKGRAGRPSKAMTLEFAMKVLDACKQSRISAYFVVSLMTGVRTEEARALRWQRVHLKAEKGKAPNVEVWRSVRAHGAPRPRRAAVASPCQISRYRPSSHTRRRRRSKRRRRKTG
ncbi:MAG: site-specific integrase [Actinomycetia bacterium]|nr:site-specific integrase [Actinomycetes bacterium]